MFTQAGQVTDELIRRFPAVRLQVSHQHALSLSHVVNGGFRLGSDALNFLILIQYQFCGATDGCQVLMKTREKSLFLPARQPEELVEHTVNSANQAGEVRSEERRVGKECRCRWSRYH